MTCQCPCETLPGSIAIRVYWTPPASSSDINFPPAVSCVPAKLSFDMVLPKVNDETGCYYKLAMDCHDPPLNQADCKGRYRGELSCQVVGQGPSQRTLWTLSLEVESVEAIGTPGNWTCGCDPEECCAGCATTWAVGQIYWYCGEVPYGQDIFLIVNNGETTGRAVIVAP